MLHIKDLSFGYSAKKQIYKNFNFSIKKGEFISILGPSGCGKSTLVDLISGYRSLKEGEILVNGKKVNKPGRDRIVMSQENDLFDWMTVYKNMKLVVDDEEVIKKYLDLTSLEDERDLYVGELSGGMKKRLSLARALAIEPQFIIMDEPFASLDYQIKEKIQEEISDIFIKDRITVLLVTHDIEEAIFLSDKIYILNDELSVDFKNQIEVPFKENRNTAIKDTKEFFDIKNQVNKIIKEDI